MSFKEKMTWVNLVVTVAIGAAYFGVVGGMVGDGSVSEIGYQWWLIGAVGVTIAATILGAIFMAIGTAIAVEVRGEGSVDDIDREDERDKTIDKRGELVGYYVSSVGILGALALAMLRQDQFWIANTLYLGLLVGSLVGSIAKLTFYRRGF